MLVCVLVILDDVVLIGTVILSIIACKKITVRSSRLIEFVNNAYLLPLQHLQ